MLIWPTAIPPNVAKRPCIFNRESVIRRYQTPLTVAYLLLEQKVQVCWNATCPIPCPQNRCCWRSLSILPINIRKSTSPTDVLLVFMATFTVRARQLHHIISKSGFTRATIRILKATMDIKEEKCIMYLKISTKDIMQTICRVTQHFMYS